MSVQSRIHTFETLNGGGTIGLQSPLSPKVIPSTPPKLSPSPSPPNLGRKSSLIDLKIDLKDWVLDDGSPPRANGFSGAYDDALIHFSPPKPSSVKSQKSGKAPPLPLRKPSLASLKSVSSLPPTSSPAAAPPLPRRGDSLTVEHTYPPKLGGTLTLDISSTNRHTHGSSISSFYSVSLSDKSPSPVTTVFPQHETGSSNSESFEELSASAAIASPATAKMIAQDWERAMERRQPPKLPMRPPPVTTSPPSARRAPPPPPSDRASLRSVASASSSTSFSSTTSFSSSMSTPGPSSSSKFDALSRPPPVPPAPRRRYDGLFTSLVATHSKPALLTPAQPTRRRGWRGLSVDLIRDPNDPSSPSSPMSPMSPLEDDSVSPERLPAAVIKVLWTRSKLPRPVLSAIWNECDPGRAGSLDRDSFIRGMWRIDEELRHARDARDGLLSPQGSLRRSRR
ncbi:unnamed protein product [Mycena citricolor]|uniref:EH domain-containing protein n=1 Tax=Mycena citricolor TaxID=2018698 RepID=A0AAD2HK10_9AGAR|nr:unnamed protein product [Mycena citricolor]